MKNWRTTISGFVGNAFGLLTLIALAPPELQNTIPQLFPEKYRGQCAIVLALAAFIAKSYRDKSAADAATKSPEIANSLVVPPSQPQPENKTP